MRRIFVLGGTKLSNDETINNQAYLLGEMLGKKKDIQYIQGGCLGVCVAMF